MSLIFLFPFFFKATILPDYSAALSGVRKMWCGNADPGGASLCCKYGVAGGSTSEIQSKREEWPAAKVKTRPKPLPTEPGQEERTSIPPLLTPQ